MFTKIIGAAWRDFKAHLATTFLWLAAWAVIIVAIALTLDRLFGPFKEVYFELIINFILIAVVPSIAVIWHRARLLDEPLSGYAAFSGLRLAIEKRTAGYILRSLLISSTYIAPIMLIWSLVALMNILRLGPVANTPYETAPPAPGLVMIAMVGLVILFAVTVFVVMRLSPWLPAYAVEDPRPVREIWAASKGLALPLFGSLFCFGLAFLLFQIIVEGVVIGLLTMLRSSELQWVLFLTVDVFFRLLGALGGIGILTRAYDCMTRQAPVPDDRLQA